MTAALARWWRAAATAARLLLVAAAVATVLLLATPGRAQAHATLLFTTPTAEAAEPASPTSMVLVFNEPSRSAGTPWRCWPPPGCGSGSRRRPRRGAGPRSRQG